MNESETDKHNMDVNKISIERLAFAVYHMIYAPDEHPNYHKYKNYTEWVTGEFSEMILLEQYDIMCLLLKQLENNNHPKFVLFRNIMIHIDSTYFNNILPCEIEDWYRDSVLKLSVNPHAKLSIFPINIWYKMDGEYKDDNKYQYY
jgi:hypothetical protein